MRTKEEIAIHIHALLDEAAVPREGVRVSTYEDVPDKATTYGLAARTSIFIGMKSKEAGDE